QGEKLAEHVAVRIKDGQSLAVRHVLGAGVGEERRFSGTGFPDDVEVLLPLAQGDSDRRTATSEGVLAYDDIELGVMLLQRQRSGKFAARDAHQSFRGGMFAVGEVVERGNLRGRERELLSGQSQTVALVAECFEER